MKHTSVQLPTPCEFIETTSINPLISKCQIKVCYVSDEPNRNNSVITKEVATEMGKSLPGSPIVGYYNEDKEDFEQHNTAIEIVDGKIQIKPLTKPYGFVDTGAKVWFQKFLDDDQFEREYLMTEGYIWTGQYPESQRVIDKGNNQSMELDGKNLQGSWTKDEKGKLKFFIINEAIISKLCILGEDNEPCFEGANIVAAPNNYSFEDDFKQQLFSMINEIKDLLKEGREAPVFTLYAVEIGDALWQAMYSYIETVFPAENSEYPCSKYSIGGIWEEGTQKFAILRERGIGKLYRLNFTYDESGITSDNGLTEVELTYIPKEAHPTFTLYDIEAYEAERYATKKDDEEEEPEEEVCPKCGKPLSECTCEEEEDDEDKKKYSAEQYEELVSKFEKLTTDFEALQKSFDELKENNETLKQFKLEADRKEKKAMIDGFYMLSDEDKKEVIDNIDNYSLDDIEAKLSIICVRNRVSFDLEDDTKHQDPVTYTLGDTGKSTSTPDWVKSLQFVANESK